MSDDDKTLDIFELLPNMVKLQNSSIVVKYGGNAMVNEEAQRNVVKDLVLLHLMGIKPLVVHGGGPAISEHMNRVGLETEFVEGQRKTDEDTLEIVEMVLCGKVNNQIVKMINSTGSKAVGLSGKDGRLITARKHLRSVMKEGEISTVDLGHVGMVESIDDGILRTLLDSNYIPVIAPIGIGLDGMDYNINADVLAGEIASAVNADKLIYLTDVDGILKDPEDPSSLMEYMNVMEAKGYINNIITGGMIPKVESSIRALENGVGSAYILNGMKKHSILYELLSERIEGTMIQPDL
ncbi:MAG: acetylglutamate kinase [Thermoplasmatota archaeon]